MSITFVQDMDVAIRVMRNAGKWMAQSGKNPSKWWLLKNLNRKFLIRHAKENEFYVGLVDGEPAVAAVLMILDSNDDWKSIDGDQPKKALYIHWLCVARRFAGRGLPNIMVDFATRLAKNNGVGLLRLDANAEKKKLQAMYDNLGFKLIGTKQESYRKTAFYQKELDK